MISAPSGCEIVPQATRPPSKGYCSHNFFAILVTWMAWAVETLNAAVDAEVNALPADMRAQPARISFLIQEFGLERVREPHVKHLQGPL
ncbi:MAG: hypothetical protein ACREF3_12580 [Acetobacteraceae bacterium]